MKPISDHEARIVWLRNPAGLSYLRECVYRARFTKKGQWPPRREREAILFAYEVIEPMTRTPGAYYDRRYWKVCTDRDPCSPPPAEAVYPESIHAAKARLASTSLKGLSPRGECNLWRAARTPPSFFQPW